MVSQLGRLFVNSKNKINMIVIFFLGIGIAIGAGVFRDVNDEEGGHFTFQIQEEKQQVETIDLAKQGMLKYYLQPGTITLYGRGKSGLQDAEIYIKFYGEKGFLSQGSKKNIWTELTEEMPLKSRKNGIVPINIEVEIPYTSTRQYEVGKAVLEFWNENQRVNSINFLVINSNYHQKS